MKYVERPAVYIDKDIDISDERVNRLKEEVEITGNIYAEERLSASFLEYAGEEEWDHFWTKVFTLRRMREVMGKGSKRELFDFQSDHKYLLMAYSPSIQKQLGRLLARGREVPFYELKEEYSQLLTKALETPPTRERHINACQHIAGHVKRQLSQEEKTLLENRLEQYGSGEISLHVVRRTLKEWADKYEDSYIQSQAYLKPHPFVEV
ncbi:YbgA family protein [Salimicrobium flavidum]|uniref:Uncharacterized conserved protein YbgA, DUF1722 family n=1 Tax=Salimicrobium flavidum TaxID=570947 RepID=A0A1N7IV01_9BACI|nr:YbgA family protein [Salimicrobium flavidum]SIS40939.1 Uncharacterized conserved protein YbgA, DUF1722 family [Salimicrobium flavidum]